MHYTTNVLTWVARWVMAQLMKRATSLVHFIVGNLMVKQAKVLKDMRIQFPHLKLM